MLGKPSDMWSLGIIMFYLLYSRMPFKTSKSHSYNVLGEFAIAENADDKDLIPSQEAKDLIKKLLCVDPLKRLTINQALRHEWIWSINHQWNYKKNPYVILWKKAFITVVVTTNRFKKIAENAAKFKELPFTKSDRYDILFHLGKLATTNLICLY